MHKVLFVQDPEGFQDRSAHVLQLLSVQSSFVLSPKVAVEMSQCNGCRSRGILYLIDEWSKERSAMLESLENVAFILYPGMAYNTLYHDSLVCGHVSENQLGLIGMRR
jgi:hypothetical protein